MSNRPLYWGLSFWFEKSDRKAQRVGKGQQKDQSRLYKDDRIEKWKNKNSWNGKFLRKVDKFQ